MLDDDVVLEHFLDMLVNEMKFGLRDGDLLTISYLAWYLEQFLRKL